MSFFNQIRQKEKPAAFKGQAVYTAAILLLGIGLGIVSKFLDCTASNELPLVFQVLDVRNFLSRLGIWILLAVCISIYSNSPARAALHVFLFFAGMVTSYYLYSRFIAGFFPRSYAMIWFGLTAVSPALAAVCWYAKGKGRLAFVLSSMIIGVLFNLTFVYGWVYIDIRSALELIVFICGLGVLKRDTMKETGEMIVMGMVFGFILDWLVPFHFG